MAGFWAGFGPAMADRINSRRDAMEERAAKRRQYLTEEGYKRRAQRNELVQTVKTSASYLSNLGMDEDRIKYLIDSDPNGLLTLAAQTQKANESGKSRLTGTDLNSAVTMLEDQNVPAGSLTDVIENRFETFMRVQQGEKPARSGANLFAAMLGYDDSEIKAVYNEELVDGYTGADIAASLDRPIMDTSGIGSANIDYSKVNTTTIDMSAFSSVATDVSQQIVDMVKKAKDKIRNDPDLTPAQISKKLSSIEENPAQLSEVVSMFKMYEAALPGIISKNPLLPKMYLDLFAAAEGESETPAAATNEITTTVLPPMGDTTPAAPSTTAPASTPVAPVGGDPRSRRSIQEANQANAAAVANTPSTTPTTDALNLPDPTPEEMRAAPVFPDEESFWEAYSADPETISTYKYIRIGNTGVVYANQYFKGDE
jgi:hypothetical protein